MAKNKGGRPPHTPTKATRARVKLLKADGWSNERVAANLMICRNTLDEHYPLELQYGADEKRAEVLESMDKASKKGNAAAGKWLHERFASAPPIGRTTTTVLRTRVAPVTTTYLYRE
jgi:hypothetical protein